MPFKTRFRLHKSRKNSLCLVCILVHTRQMIPEVRQNYHCSLKVPMIITKTVCTFLGYMRQYSVLRVREACANLYGWGKHKFWKWNLKQLLLPFNFISGGPPTSSTASKNHGIESSFCALLQINMCWCSCVKKCKSLKLWPVSMADLSLPLSYCCSLFASSFYYVDHKSGFP